MIVQKEFLDKLKDFGLNSYERKLWIALLSRGVSTAGELSDISNVPRSRAYDVLESLEKKGFIVVKVGKPIKYLAVSPSEVIERVKKKVIEEADQKSKVLSKLKDSELLEELTSLHQDGVKLVDPTDRSGAFRGREKVYEHLLMMIKNAKKSVTIMTSAEGLERKNNFLHNHLKRSSKNGVSIKISVPMDAEKETIDNLSKFATVKTIKNSDARFCVVDNKELMLFLTDDQKVHKSYDCAVWIEAPYFVKFFNSLFEKEWNGK
jgi:HTH-type transcriptional regulator, sugar sensing transcriptional regulator